MAIEKMKLISIVGKGEKVEEFIAKYLLNSGIQPENALAIWDKGWKLENLPKDTLVPSVLSNCEKLIQELKIQEDKPIEEKTNTPLGEIKEELQTIQKEYQKWIQKRELLTQKKEDAQEKLYPICYLKDLDMDLRKLYTLRYIRFRFGKIPKQAYVKMQKQIEDNNVIMIELKQEGDFSWILYFTTSQLTKQIDSYFNVMEFERIWLPEEVQEKPNVFLEKENKQIEECEVQIENCNQEIQELKTRYQLRLLQIKEELINYEKINKIKKYFLQDEKGNFYFAGWIPNSERKELTAKLEEQEKIEYDIKDTKDISLVPPTKLKNCCMVRPFQMLTKMYGIPNYKEADPTFLVAITAFFMFGFMFGDVGQGFLILLLGIFIRAKNKIGSLFMLGGISSILFGFVYGSVFGKEDILPGFVIRPMENITTMLVSGIAIGAILILIAMLYHIRNAIKRKDLANIFLDANGIAGFIFYLVLAISIASFVTTNKLFISEALLGGILVVTFLFMLLKQPIANALKKKEERQKGSFAEILFEMLENLLSFASNTISFIRLAAFAINHVGLCMAVSILANMVSGASSILIVVIGNFIIVGLEGLIVGIQVLRLEYYELFSRFYTGDGREYKPIKELI